VVSRVVVSGLRRGIVTVTGVGGRGGDE
jgi:hypothetical protein